MKQPQGTHTFICQLTETQLKVLKLLGTKSGTQRLAGFALEPIPPESNDTTVSQILIAVCKKLGFNRNPLILCLPRHSATCRYLKVPTQAPQEIEKIINLQAPKYLPYQSHELITGYQHIENDLEGYAQIEAIIVNKEGIERYLNIFKVLKANVQSIVLSSYGVAKLFTLKTAQEPAPTLILNIDVQQAEIIIQRYGKVLFSRTFKTLMTQSHWENIFLNELDKTKDAYLKDTGKAAPIKIFVTGYQKGLPKIKELLVRHGLLPVETIPCINFIQAEQALGAQFTEAEGSFASLLGLGLAPIEDSLNLLPGWAKQEAKSAWLRKESIKILASCIGIFLILSLAFAKHVQNKKYYLARLKSELTKVAKTASPLEAIDKRLQLLQGRLKNRLSSLDVLEGISKASTDQIWLSSLIYEEEAQIVIHGQTPILTHVLDFVSSLEKIPAFRSLSVKIRYATQKRNQSGEFIDFEIVCLKENKLK